MTDGSATPAPAAPVARPSEVDPPRRAAEPRRRAGLAAVPPPARRPKAPPAVVPPAPKAGPEVVLAPPNARLSKATVPNAGPEVVVPPVERDPEPAPTGLVGRDHELTELRAALDRLGTGPAYAPQLVEITGEPGIGKTRLLTELAALATGRGLLVLSGLAAEPTRGVPFGVVVDALDDHVGERGGQNESLGSIFPSLPQCGRLDLPRAHRALRDLLEELSGTGLVLLLDDLHWADAETVALLAYLIRRPPRAPLLLALAHRDRQAPVSLRAAVAGTGDGFTPRRLHPGPLGEADVETLLAGRGTRSWRRALLAESGGNPFYLEVLAEAGPARPAGGAPELPPVAEVALLTELEAVTPAARLVARAAAVAGEQFPTDLVADIAGQPEDEVLAAVDELVGRDLIRPGSDARRFRFRHPLVREVAYASSNPGWRIAAHGRAAEALQRRRASPVSRAHHMECAARPGDLAAVAVLDEAAREVEYEAPATAASWLAAALRLLPHEPAVKSHRAILQVRMARALGVAGLLRESRDLAHESLRLLPRRLVSARAAAVAFCAQVERSLGRRAEAEALLREEVAALPEQDSLARASLMFGVASGRLVDGDPETSNEQAAEVLAIARRCGNSPLQAGALGIMAIAAASLADTQTARARLDEAAGLVDAMLQQELAETLESAVWVGWAELVLERWEDALRHLDRALALTRTGGSALVRPHLLVGRALALRVLGRLAEARSAAEDAVEAARLSGSGEQRVSALYTQYWVETLTGTADDELRAAVAATDPHTTAAWTTTFAARMLGEARLALDDAEGCLALTAVAGGAQLPAAELGSRVAWYELLTRAELAQGRIEQAQEHADRALFVAAQLELPGRTGLALLAKAHVLAVGDPASAPAVAAEAAAALEKAGMVLDAARARLVGATALTASDAELAAVELKSVQTEFERCGARLLARQALAQRRRLAARATRRGRTSHTAGVAALTRREQQVAALVSEGLTNRRIALRLFVTEKTVEMHMANIFGKLGVSSRAAVARIVTSEVTA